MNWNAAQDTIECVQKISQWSQINLYIWVVDNASTSDDVAEIQQACPQINLLQNVTNLGFAGGTNRGIKSALSAHDDVPILLLNNDASIDESSVVALLNVFQRIEKAGIVGPALYEETPPYELISAGSQNPILHHYIPIRQIDIDQEFFFPHYVSGTIAIIHPDVCRQIGFLNEDYFFCLEMADFCRRAAQSGYRSVIALQTKGYHDTHRSSSFRSTLYPYYTIRNRFIYIHTFYKILKWPLLLFWTLYGIAHSLKQRLGSHTDLARSMAMGVQDGLQKRWGGQNERVLSVLQSLNR